MAHPNAADATPLAVPGTTPGPGQATGLQPAPNLLDMFVDTGSNVDLDAVERVFSAAPQCPSADGRVPASTASTASVGPARVRSGSSRDSSSKRSQVAPVRRASTAGHGPVHLGSGQVLSAASPGGVDGGEPARVHANGHDGGGGGGGGGDDDDGSGAISSDALRPPKVPSGTAVRATHRGGRRLKQFKARVYTFTYLGKAYTRREKLWRAFVVFMVLLSTMAVMTETVAFETAGYRRFKGARDAAVVAIEVITVLLFTVEFVLRLWSCSEAFEFPADRPVMGRLRVLASPATVFDMLCMVPLLLHVVSLGAVDIFGDSRLAFYLRVWRVLRIFKFLRYFPAVRVLILVVKLRGGELLTSLVLSLLIVIVLAALVFMAESKSNPIEYPSMGTALWWSVVHLSTVGYGDISPATPLGRLFGAIGAVVGIGLFTLPAGIIASGFLDYREQQSRLTQHHVSTLVRIKRRALLHIAIRRLRAKCKFVAPSRTSSRARMLVESVGVPTTSDELSRTLRASKMILTAQDLLRQSNGRLDVAMSALIECQQKHLGPTPYGRTVAVLLQQQQSAAQRPRSAAANEHPTHAVSIPTSVPGALSALAEHGGGSSSSTQ